MSYNTHYKEKHAVRGGIATPPCRNSYAAHFRKLTPMGRNLHSDHMQNKIALDIYYQLLKYVQTHFSNISQSGGLLPLIAYNYARCLDLDKRYEDALYIAQLGMQACVQYGQYNTLPSTMAVMAECYHFLSEDDKSKELYYQAYYTSRSMQDIETTNIIRQEMEIYFGVQPTY